MPYDQIPSKASLKIEPFKAHVTDLQLEGFKFLLRVSPIGPQTYENTHTDVNNYTSFGIKRSWLEEAKQYWLEKYDWRKTEDRFNTYNNYTTEIDDEGFKYQIHFIALFSKKKDAVPLLLNHGWPGSFIEFLDVLDEFKSKYDENSLPYHIIVPSLPGYGYSNGPPTDRNTTTEDGARVLNNLMVGIGFGDGYVSQGGDIGSFISRILVVDHEACKAAHINLAIGAAPENDEEANALSDQDKKYMSRTNDFATMGNAYARMHGTRPGTIGLVLSSSPIALLAWVGEKFDQWTDTNPPLEQILDDVTLYWFTNSFPRAIYGYRQFFAPQPQFWHNDPNYYVKKPFGYSLFPEELAPVPISIVKKTGNLVFHREHKEGGHFAAMEKPKLFVKDMEDFIAVAWTKSKI